MRFSRLALASLFSMLAVVAVSSAVHAQLTGGTVIQREERAEDMYLAGGSVYVLARIDGDIVAAGGNVTIESDVTGDVLAAGGNVTVRGRVSDDVRVAGGNVTLAGIVGDDAAAAGGSVMLAPTASVKGRAWLAGANVEVHGQIGRGLRAAGRRVAIAGEITGDAEITAEIIEILPDAVITGSLRYRSPNEARIDGTARIAGSIAREEITASPMRGILTGAAKAGLYLSLLVTGIVLYLLFPRTALDGARTIESSPWKSLGLGLAFLIAMPVVALLLFLTVLGIGLGAIALVFYFTVLLLGLLAAALYAADAGLEQFGKGRRSTKGWRVLALAAALFALWVISLIPWLGGFVIFAVLVFGTGALVLVLGRRYAAANP